MNLRIENLSKRYPNGVQALSNVSLDVSAGMFGLLGPNGAGKSTLMRTLATLQEADSGSAFIGSIDVLKQKDEVRKILGYLPQEFGLYPKVSAQEMLDHFARLKGVGPAKHRREVVGALLKKTNLFDVRNRSLGTFSGGMKQRFGIAQALLGDPKLIIVDEPTAGLDPEERSRFHNLLSEIGEEIVVILSTHIVDDVANLCQQMAIINHGRAVLQGAPFTLASELRGRIWRKFVAKDEVQIQQAAYNVILVRRQAGKMLIHVDSPDQPDPTFEAVEPDLEDVYFRAIRHSSGSPAPIVPPIPVLTAQGPH